MMAGFSDGPWRCAAESPRLTLSGSPRPRKPQLRRATWLRPFQLRFANRCFGSFLPVWGLGPLGPLGAFGAFGAFGVRVRPQLEVEDMFGFGSEVSVRLAAGGFWGGSGTQRGGGGEGVSLSPTQFRGAFSTKESPIEMTLSKAGENPTSSKGALDLGPLSSTKLDVMDQGSQNHSTLKFLVCSPSTSQVWDALTGKDS